MTVVHIFQFLFTNIYLKKFLKILKYFKSYYVIKPNLGCVFNFVEILIIIIRKWLPQITLNNTIPDLAGKMVLDMLSQ